MIENCIDEVFSYLEKTDYGYSYDRQEIEARFWDRFFDYFSKLQKTEQLRVITQLSDLVKEARA